MADRMLYEKEMDDGGRAELYERNDGSPEIFIDGAWGIAYGNDGIFKINLFSRGLSSDPHVERREVAVRLAMSHLTLSQLSKLLNEQVANLVDKGFIVQQSEVAEIQQAAGTKISGSKKSPARKNTKSTKPKSKPKQKSKSKA